MLFRAAFKVGVCSYTRHHSLLKDAMSGSSSCLRPSSPSSQGGVAGQCFTPEDSFPVAFKPLSRLEVAGILSVSIRTLENWQKAGLMPRSVDIGGRVYWHPEVFYEWLDHRLRPTVEAGSDSASGVRRGGCDASVQKSAPRPKRHESAKRAVSRNAEMLAASSRALSRNREVLANMVAGGGERFPGACGNPRPSSALASRLAWDIDESNV